MKEFEGKDLKEIFIELTAYFKPKIVLELGAREASYSCKVSELLPEAQIYAFEANPYCYERYSKQIEAKKYPVDYLHLIISDTVGQEDFIFLEELEGKKIDPYNGGQSIKPRSTEESVTSTTKVDSITGEYFLKERWYNEESIALWVDVEGANKEVFTGMGAYMDNVILVHCEVEKREIWEDQWLDKDTIEFCEKYNLVPIAKDNQAKRQYNVIFVKEEFLTDSTIEDIMGSYVG